MKSPERPEEGVSYWEPLVELIARQDPEAVRRFIESVPDSEVPRLYAHLSADDRDQLVMLLEPNSAAALLEHLASAQAAELLGELEPSVAAAIVDSLPSNEQADVLTDLPPASASAILDSMQPEEAADAGRLIQYGKDSAGGLMITEYLSYQEHASVGDVLDDLRGNADKYRRHDVQYVYITNPREELRGVLRLRDLVLAPRSAPVSEIMIRDTDSVSLDTPMEALDDFFETRPYRGVPVVDDRGRLVGVVRHADVAEAIGDRVTSDHLKAQGIVGGEELRTMPVFTRAWRRLSWLSINIVLNLIAASVIAIYQDTLSAVIVLAVFLPIISDMSGCSGNQAIAVSMRELTLGVIRPEDTLRVWRQELSVGLINALALGTLLGGAAFLWQGNVYLSLVVGLALMINTMVSVSLGGIVPLVLRALQLDPALASGPILTTVTDMCGFFFVLSFASLALPLLQG